MGREPGALHAAFAIDVSPDAVVFAPDIGPYRERKLRLLNGTHTALASVALLAGVPTVQEAVADPRLGPFLRHVLCNKLVPATTVPRPAAEPFARTTLERFGNPWLDHEWRVIAQNQTARMRLRVVPAIPRLTCCAYRKASRCVAPRTSATFGASPGPLGVRVRDGGAGPPTCWPMPTSPRWTRTGPPQTPHGRRRA